jgi:hypothetical protein
MNTTFFIWRIFLLIEQSFELKQQLLARTVANMWLGKEKEITRIINDDICPLF